MQIVFSLRLPRDEVSVPAARHVCRDALRVLGVVPDCIDDIELAVTEACTNVLKHATATNDEYDVDVQIDESRCTIRVIDTGVGFDHEGWPSGPAPQAQEGGRGIHLMTALVDDLKFVSKPETGTVVHLEKALALTDGSILGRLARLA